MKNFVERKPENLGEELLRPLWGPWGCPWNALLSSSPGCQRLLRLAFLIDLEKCRLPGRKGGAEAHPGLTLGIAELGRQGHWHPGWRQSCFQISEPLLGGHLGPGPSLRKGTQSSQHLGGRPGL